MDTNIAGAPNTASDTNTNDITKKFSAPMNESFATPISPLQHSLDNLMACIKKIEEGTKRVIEKLEEGRNRHCPSCCAELLYVVLPGGNQNYSEQQLDNLPDELGLSFYGEYEEKRQHLRQCFGIDTREWGYDQGETNDFGEAEACDEDSRSWSDCSRDCKHNTRYCEQEAYDCERDTRGCENDSRDCEDDTKDCQDNTGSCGPNGQGESPEEVTSVKEDDLDSEYEKVTTWDYRSCDKFRYPEKFTGSDQMENNRNGIYYCDGQACCSEWPVSL
jgi:hypothetical protein